MSKFRAEVTGSGENTWSTNARTFETEEEAETYLRDLMFRWMGCDQGRVVPVETPLRQQVSPDDKILVSYR